MRSGRSSTVTADPVSIHGDEDPSRWFYSHLAQGLHAMAQPLTILRTSVRACSMPGLTPEQHRRYLNISTEQVERACVLFDSMQDLVIAMQMEPKRGSVDLEAMIDLLVDDQEAALNAAKVSARIAKRQNLSHLLGDASRVRNALQSILKIAVALSSPGDVIELTIGDSDGWVGCTVRNERTHGRTLDSLQQFSLALAETNIRSQQGRYQCVLDPLSISWALPAQSRNH
jgi:hypothetical protein